MSRFPLDCEVAQNVPWKDSSSPTIYVRLRFINMAAYNGNVIADTTSRFVVPRCHELAGFYWQYMAPEEKRVEVKVDHAQANWTRFLKIIGFLWHTPQAGALAKREPLDTEPVIDVVHTRGGPLSILKHPQVVCNECKSLRTQMTCKTAGCTHLICAACASYKPWCFEHWVAMEQSPLSSYAPGLVANPLQKKRKQRRRVVQGRKTK